MGILSALHHRFGRRGSTIILLFFATFLIQTYHYTEHIVQTYQHWILNVPAEDAHGIIAFADTELVHFIYGWAYFFMLALLAYFLLHDREFTTLRKLARGKAAIGFFVFGTALQWYHMLENTGQLAQYLQTNCDPCPGIFFGFYFDAIYVHFWLNTFVYLPFIILPMVVKELRSYHAAQV